MFPPPQEPDLGVSIACLGEIGHCASLLSVLLDGLKQQHVLDLLHWFAIMCRAFHGFSGVSDPELGSSLTRTGGISEDGISDCRENLEFFG